MNLIIGRLNVILCCLMDSVKEFIPSQDSIAL